MAQVSLRETIMRGGGLEQTSQEELAALAGRKKPIQPLESAVLGANPDQAKMAGTPGQKESAIRSSVKEGSDLTTAIRRGQGRTKATAEEKADTAQREQLGKLSSLETRVDTMAENALKTPVTASATNVLVPNKDLPPEQQELVKKLIANPADTASLQALNTAMGFTDSSQMLSAQDLLAKTTVDSTALGQVYAGSVTDMVTAGSLPLTEMGFNSDPVIAQQELAAALGITTDELSKMNINQLLDQVNNSIADIQQTQNATQAKLVDPNVGPAERASARKQLRDMGAVGVLAANTDLDKLADKIENADTVTVFGEDMPIGEAFKDEHLSGVIASVADGLDDQGNPITDFAKTFMNDPKNEGMAKWIKENLALAKEASANISEEQAGYAALQETNKTISQSKEGGFSISDEAMKSVFPDWGSQRTEAYDTASYPLFGMMANSTDKTLMNNLGQIVNTISDRFPDMMGEFAKLSEKDLKAIAKSPKTIAAYVEMLDEKEKFDNYAANPTDAGMFDILGVADKGELDSLRADIKRAHNFGLISDDEYNKLEQIPGLVNGNMFEMRRKFGTLGPQSFADIKNKLKGGTLADTLAKLGGSAKEFIDGLPAPKMANAFSDDGVMDSGEWNAFVKSGGMKQMDMDKFATFLKNNKGKMDDGAYSSAKSTYDNTIKKKEYDTIAKSTGAKDGKTWLNDLLTDKNQPSYSYNQGDVKGKQAAEAALETQRTLLTQAAADLAALPVNSMDPQARKDMIKALKDKATALGVKQQELVADKNADKGVVPKSETPVEKKTVAYKTKSGDYITAEQYDKGLQEYVDEDYNRAAMLGQVSFESDWDRYDRLKQEYDAAEGYSPVAEGDKGYADYGTKQAEKRKKEAADREIAKQAALERLINQDFYRGIGY